MRPLVTPLFLGCLALASQLPASAQTAPAAKPADVGSMDGILAAVYDVISGPPGQARDWDRFRSLFAPGARLVPTGKDSTGAGRIRMWTVEDYVKNAAPGLEKSGFFEREIGRTVERYGNAAHVFSAYDSKRLATDEKPFSRGINSIQLWNDGSRWWVVTIFWESETPANPIPAKYLKPGR